MTQIGIACRITAVEVRARFVMLESMRLVVGLIRPRREPNSAAAGYAFTREARRKAGVGNNAQVVISTSDLIAILLMAAIAATLASWLLRRGRMPQVMPSRPRQGPCNNLIP